MSINHIAVIGAGTMGNGIAHVFALAGHDVTLIDVDQSRLDAGLAQIEKNLGRQVKKEQITEQEQVETLARIACATDLSADAAEADLVVEAATENPAIKAEIFRALDKATKPDVHPRLEHVVDLDHADRGRDRAAGAGDRDALLQPGPGDEARRDRARARNLRRDVPGRLRLCPRSSARRPSR